MLGLIEKARPNEIKGTLTVAFVAQHWTGGRGMNRLLTEVHPDEMIFVGHVAARSPADNPAGGHRGGCTKTWQWSFDWNGVYGRGCRGFVGELKALAETDQIPVAVLSGNLPRIAGYVPGADPKRTVEIGLPILWAESPAEAVNRKDAANLFGLLANYAGVNSTEEIKPEYSTYESFPARSKNW
jgi:putative aminopeptidase FrvX